MAHHVGVFRINFALTEEGLRVYFGIVDRNVLGYQKTEVKFVTTVSSITY